MTVFKPTKAMIRARFILQRNCPPHTLKSLRPDDPDLARYLAPYPVISVRKWLEKDRRFWLWFLTPCDFEPKFLEAKELALTFYTSMLRTSHTFIDPETGKEAIDKTLLNAKLKIAERLIGSGQDKAINLTVSQNSQNLNTGNEAPLPLAMRKNPGILEGKIRQLKEARMQQDEQIYEIGEAK
jgi:hypothetical protein